MLQRNLPRCRRPRQLPPPRTRRPPAEYGYWALPRGQCDGGTEFPTALHFKDCTCEQLRIHEVYGVYPAVGCYSVVEGNDVLISATR